MPAERPPSSAGGEEHLVAGRVGREQAGRHREHHAEDQHHLAAVAVAERAEVEHRGGQAERVADGDQVERRLRRVEAPCRSSGRATLATDEVQVGDGGDEDQRQQHPARLGGLRRFLRGRGSHRASIAVGAAARRRPLGMKCARTIPGVPGEDGYFDERVAARYDESTPEMFDPAVVEPAVDFLAELAGDGRALELGDRHRPDRAAARAARRAACTGSTCRRRWSRGCARSRAARTIEVTIGDFATTTRRRDVLGRLPRLQHDHEPDDAGRAGRLLPQRRRAPRAGRLLRDRGRRARTSGGSRPARRFARLRRQRDALGDRRVRRREPGPHLAPLRARRREARARLDARSATSGRRSST